MTATDDQIRLSIFMSMIERGIPEDAAGTAMYALHPFESDIPPARALEKPVRKRSKRLARELKSTPPTHVGVLARRAIQEYQQEAIRVGDDTYRQRFEQVLEKS